MTGVQSGGLLRWLLGVLSIKDSGTSVLINVVGKLPKASGVGALNRPKITMRLFSVGFLLRCTLKCTLLHTHLLVRFVIEGECWGAM